MSKKVFTNSVQELNTLLEKGYALVHWSENEYYEPCSFTLEKNTKWSKLHGGR